ncbi:AI-2E family transporter [Candidatus Peregrinibacteria bacterium]|nr:MAG: AI-2E family transporter [Candidatus Peregrinibacteria bacterium]
MERYQGKITELKERIRSLTDQDEVPEPSEKPALRAAEKPEQVVRVILPVGSAIKATVAVLGVIGFAYLLFFLKDVLIVFLVALFLAAAFNPAVNRLESHRVPRWLGILILYLVVLGIITLVFTSLVPIVAEQVTNLALSIRGMIQNIVSGQSTDSRLIQWLQPLVNQVWQNIDQTEILNSLTTSLSQLGTKLTDFAGNAIGAIFTIFNGIFNLILVLIITFFMVLNRRGSNSFFQSLFPARYSRYITEKTQQISVRIGEWVRGQVLLALAMALLTFIVFSIIGLNFALTLSMVSAFGEFLPYLGPLITFLSAGLIALNQDPVLVLWLIPAYAFIQFLEGNIMVPLIIGRSVGMSPVVIMFSLLSGATLGVKLGGSYGLGLVGMIIAVPVANIISIFVEDYTGRNK